ncbi:MAG: Lon protease 1 [Microgenomates bacterium OLB22]|nr:MAG: Lon protease 1 [Microgenomates bacterium OLB22]
MKANGLASHKVSITDKALKLIIRRYTREAGVRELERQVATVYRKIALEVVEGTTKAKKVIESTVLGYLGQYKYSDQVIEHEDTVGMSTGLAWTQAGGDILLIEVAVMPGKGRLTITGQLGEVMKESCQAAFSYVRARYDLFGLKKNFYSDIDIHIHVPEGAVPKDGPSAGLAIATAMISALTKVPVNRLVGMTGEITLRGRALPIGGVKEKIIAAHRAGLKLIILPKENKKDLEDVPTAVKEDLEFVFVEHMDDVLKRAFVFPRKNFKFADGVVAN